MRKRKRARRPPCVARLWVLDRFVILHKVSWYVNARYGTLPHRRRQGFGCKRVSIFNANTQRTQSTRAGIPNGFLASFFLNRPEGIDGSSFFTRRRAFIQFGSNRGDIGSSPDAVDTVFVSGLISTSSPYLSSRMRPVILSRSASCVRVDLSDDTHRRPLCAVAPNEQTLFGTHATHRFISSLDYSRSKWCIDWRLGAWPRCLIGCVDVEKSWIAIVRELRFGGDVCPQFAGS